MRSTKSQGMLRGGICRSRARKATSGTTPFSSRRTAPRAPTSTEPTFSTGRLATVSWCRSTSLTRTTLRPRTSMTCWSSRSRPSRSRPSAPSLWAQSAVGASVRMPPLIEVTETNGSRRSPVLGPDDQHRNPGPVFLRDQRHFAHSSAAASGGVKHRRAQQFGKRKGRHGSENTQVTRQESTGAFENLVAPASRRPEGGLPRQSACGRTVLEDNHAAGETPSGQPAGRRRSDRLSGQAQNRPPR